MVAAAGREDRYPHTHIRTHTHTPFVVGWWLTSEWASSPVILSLPSSWQEHRTEIDARAGTFQAFEQFGQQLLAHGHYASPEIKEKLDILDQERTDLEKAWVQRRMMLDQCLELQVSVPERCFPLARGLLTRCFVSKALSSHLSCPSLSCFIGTASRRRTGWLPGRPS